MKAIKLEWHGKSYTIAANEAFAVGEAVEDIITIGEIGELASRPKFRKISRVYGVMLRHAGARVTDEEVFSDMMGQVKGAGQDGKELLVASAMAALVEILMDGAPEGDDDGEKKQQGAL